MVTLGTRSAPGVERWNFGAHNGKPISLDEFVDSKENEFRFFEGKEPWLKGVNRITWQNFFRVCTEEMDDLSKRATKLVIEYCLENVEAVAEQISGKVTLPRLEDALSTAYAEIYENPIYQYRWALRHPVVKEAVTLALVNRFPER